MKNINDLNIIVLDSEYINEWTRVKNEWVTIIRRRVQMKLINRCLNIKKEE